jgi:BolA protein
MGEVGNRITETLNETFRPSKLEVVDESDQHKGHAGAREGGESHFRIRITAPAFAGLSRVDIHRAINRALATELAGPVHALAIEARPA